MDYYKIEIKITPFEEWLRDVLASQLAETGFESFVETEGGLDAFVPAPDFNENELESVLGAFHNDFSFSVHKELIKSCNWNEEWEKNYFEPLVINNECVIRAPFHTEFPKAEYEIVIEPNMAFGTGNHETTSMMVEFVLEMNMENKAVLDMGCGTGILGILSSMKGAARVVAIDIDEWSFKGATENALQNKITSMEVKMGDAALLGGEFFDVILANIHKNVLLHDMPVYQKVLLPGGVLVMSGFYIEDLEIIKNTAHELGLNFKGFKEKNKWVLGAFVKQ
ncbi:MAG TPA: 50S ribosomal protein L11 methyltransferase [Prolixibacteraceae bacterium]|nr:50S ribosomal protein L11 methyltransferase [Prolixibacteraceae bacterium]